MDNRYIRDLDTKTRLFLGKEKLIVMTYFVWFSQKYEFGWDI